MGNNFRRRRTRASARQAGNMPPVSGHPNDEMDGTGRSREREVIDMPVLPNLQVYGPSRVPWDYPGVKHPLWDSIPPSLPIDCLPRPPVQYPSDMGPFMVWRHAPTLNYGSVWTIPLPKKLPDLVGINLILNYIVPPVTGESDSLLVGFRMDYLIYPPGGHVDDRVRSGSFKNRLPGTQPEDDDITLGEDDVEDASGTENIKSVSRLAKDSIILHITPEELEGMDGGKIVVGIFTTAKLPILDGLDGNEIGGPVTLQREPPEVYSPTPPPANPEQSSGNFDLVLLHAEWGEECGVLSQCPLLPVIFADPDEIIFEEDHVAYIRITNVGMTALNVVAKLVDTTGHFNMPSDSTLWSPDDCGAAEELDSKVGLIEYLLTPCAVAEFEVEFNWGAPEGTYNAYVEIYSHHAKNSPIQIPLQATVPPAP